MYVTSNWTLWGFGYLLDWTMPKPCCLWIGSVLFIIIECYASTTRIPNCWLLEDLRRYSVFLTWTGWMQRLPKSINLLDLSELSHGFTVTKQYWVLALILVAWGMKYMEIRKPQLNTQGMIWLTLVLCRLWDVRSGKIVQTLETKSPVTSAEVSQDGRYITTADGSSVKFWDANQ